jgi:DNA replication and repair protein RecF
MILEKLKLTNFRNHRSSLFNLSQTAIIIGPNTAGKTNILEAIYILSRGKSFRAEYDKDTIREGAEFAQIDAEIKSHPEGESSPHPPGGQIERTRLKVIFSLQKGYLSKKFLVNGVARRQHDFTSNFVSVLFTPHDIELITSSPSSRRKYVDSILYQANKKYRTALSVYERALKHRNRMLYDIKEGKKQYHMSDFEYFNKVLIEQGSIVSAKREEFVNFVNKSNKNIFDFALFYDKSEMSKARLFRYHFEEQKAGVTLVGPQRDDFRFYFAGSEKPIQEFGSRGEERLTIFQLKVLEVNYLLKTTGHTPVLLLDDIFSELDDANIHKVFELLPDQQTILTTTHREFLPKKILNKKEVKIIEL